MQEHEKIWEKKIDLQQQQIDNITEEYHVIRKESQGIRKMFVELLSRVTEIAAKQNSPQENAPSSSDNSYVVVEEIEALEKENKFLKEKIDAQEEIIQRLSEELEQN